MKYFEYMDFHFKPVKQLDKSMSFSKISRLIASNDIGLKIYKGGKGWNHKSFYEASSNSQMDIFYCEETGKYYLPGEHELFIFRMD